MHFLNLLAEANPNEKIGKKTADELRKEATVGKPALKAAEHPAVSQGTKGNSDATVGAIIANPPTNHTLHPAVVDEGYADYENNDDGAVLFPAPNSVIASNSIVQPMGRSVSQKKSIYLRRIQSGRPATTMTIQKITQPHLPLNSPHRRYIKRIMKG